MTPPRRSVEIDDETAYALLWGEGRRLATRGPKPTLTVEQIVEAGVALADAEGLGVLTLEGVADTFGVTKMALYRYVGGKDELVALMIEAAVEEAPDVAGIAGWRQRVTTFTDAMAAAWAAHPWVPRAAIGERAMGPRELAWVECAVACFDSTPLTGRERLDAAYLLFGHLRTSHSMSMAGTQPWLPDRHVRPALQQALGQRIERFPSVAAAVEAVTPDDPRDNGRAFGIEVILSGLERLMEARA